MMKIRPAQPDDDLPLVELWHQGWHDAHASLVPPGVLAFRKLEHFVVWREQATDEFFVAVDEILRGFVSVKRSEVVKLYVGASARGSGIAQSLLDFAEGLLLSRGVKRADLFCTAGNLRAEKFYTRRGWSIVRSFEDEIWLPKSAGECFVVPTLHLQKTLF